MTFALFDENRPDLRPLEAYALHCCWELEWMEDERAPEERLIEAGIAILRAANPAMDA